MAHANLSHETQQAIAALLAGDPLLMNGIASDPAKVAKALGLTPVEFDNLESPEVQAKIVAHANGDVEQMAEEWLKMATPEMIATAHSEGRLTGILNSPNKAP